MNGPTKHAEPAFMMTWKRSIELLGLLLAVVLSVGGCAGGESHYPGHTSVLEHIEHAPPTDTVTVTSTDHLDGIAVQSVRGVQGVAPFFVATRTQAIERFPCQECHVQPLAELRAALPDGQDAHWGLEVDAHAPADVMTCTTCHAGSDMNELELLSGRQVSFDHVYLLCAQCHQTQADDWVGGAHGKRLGGWAPPRVTENCTGCHDPHAPAFPQRLPARAGELIQDDQVQD